MGRLIDEDSVIDIVVYECGEWSGLAKEIVKQIKALSSAERKGHWEPYLKEGLKYKCSVCGSRFELAWTYCPHCGARMEDKT